MVRHSGDIVKSALKDKGMTQAELAKKIGKHQSLISRFISGQSVSDTTARSIAEALGLDFEELRHQLQRDRLDHQKENLKTEFKEVLSEEEESNILASEGEATIGYVGLVTRIPLLDFVPAGERDQRWEEAEMYAVPSSVQLDAEKSFALKTYGENMTDDKIDEGDIIVVDPSAKTQDGDRVLIILNGVPALKKIYRKGKTIILRSPESSREPLIVLSQKDDFKIIGRVISCIKFFQAE